MTNTEHLMAIAAEVGVNVDELPDTLETTLLKAIIEKSGGDTSMLPDNLKSTLYTALAECAGGGGGGVTDYNDLINKPCYSETSVKDILPETTVEIDPESGEGYVIDVMDVRVGNTYTVKWNGAEYTCVAQLFDVEVGIAAATLGNLGAMTGGDETGEPFVVMCFDAETAEMAGVCGMVYALDGSASATLFIRGEVEVVHKLDEKYLPLGVTKLYTDNTYLYKSSEMTEDSRIAKVELKSLWFGKGKVFLCGYSEDRNTGKATASYFTPHAYCETEDYAFLSVFGDGITSYHTAEYSG